MKKIVVVLGLALFLPAFIVAGGGKENSSSSPSFFVPRRHSLAVGVVVSPGYAGALGLPLGLSLYVPEVPVYWGVRAHFFPGTYGFDVTGDYHFFANELVREENFVLDWFLGAGGFMDVDWGTWGRFDLGVRVPAGLSWHVNNPWEVFFAAAPGIGFYVQNGTAGFFWKIGTDLGVRYWFGP